jgi:hypothetical protein
MTLPALCALLHDRQLDDNLRCHVGYHIGLSSVCTLLLTKEYHINVPRFFFFLLCPLVWKGSYSVSLMQPVFVDIHQLCCSLLSFIFLSLPPTSSSISISSLCFSSPHSYFTLHAVILFSTLSHPQFSCVRISAVCIVNIIRGE